MSQEIEISIAYPIAEKSVGRFNCRRATFHRDKTERPDPGLEAHLAQCLANPVSGLLPHTVHSSPPHAGPCPPRPAIESHNLGSNYAQPYPHLLISQNFATSIGH